MNDKNDSLAAIGTVPDATVIEPSGKTDDIRYVLNTTPVEVTDAVIAGDHETPQTEAGLSRATGGLSDLIIDDADSQLPDRTGSTIEGGQVGKESKRGAY